ncbi:MAG: peptidase T [Spirochaetia bacterium]|nr:peptidase T [Spirochaetia bacterium]
MNTATIEQLIVERFLRYTAIDTRSDDHIATKPSTAGQWDLLHLLVKELKELGLEDVSLNADGFLIARIPSNIPGSAQPPVIGFMAHVDTSPDMPGNGVRPQIIEAYDGSDIPLGDQWTLTTADNPLLKKYVGSTIITTDGRTLLGADDKAGVAEIMAVLQYYHDHPEIRHGALEIIFTADEETGHGMDGFPLEQLHARCCYTMDGGRSGEIESECFHANRVDITFTGVMYHPGAARGRMVNAITMANRFCMMIPQSESPETTDEREGYYYLGEISGDSSSCTLIMNLRDFEASGMERRIRVVEAAAHAVQESSAAGKVDLKVIKQYVNMAEYVSKDPLVMEKLQQAVERAGITPIMQPIRGGTDGARLSEMGIPAPNIFAGGVNFHSRFEWVAVPAMVEAAVVIDTLIHLWSSEQA